MKIGDTVYIVTPVLHNVFTAIVKDIDVEGCLLVKYIPQNITLRLSRKVQTESLIFMNKEQAEKAAFMIRLKGG